MGIALKFLGCILAIGIAGLFVVKRPDGSPWLKLQDVIPDPQAILTQAKEVIPSKNTIGDNSRNTVYRWKDANGNWHFSDSPPENQEAESISLSGDLNKDLIAPLSNARQVPTTIDTPIVEKSIEKPVLSPTSLGPEQISKLLKDAKNLQQLIDDRKAALDQQQ